MIAQLKLMAHNYQLSPAIYLNELGDPRTGSTLDHTWKSGHWIQYIDGFA